MDFRLVDWFLYWCYFSITFLEVASLKLLNPSAFITARSFSKPEPKAKIQYQTLSINKCFWVESRKDPLTVPTILSANHFYDTGCKEGLLGFISTVGQGRSSEGVSQSPSGIRNREEENDVNAPLSFLWPPGRIRWSHVLRCQNTTFISY